jgi:hypothetical protein
MAADKGKEPLLSRLRKEGPKEMLLEFGRMALQSIASPWLTPIWVGIVAIVSGGWAWVSGLDPFVKWVAFLLAIGAALWIANLVRVLLSADAKSANKLAASGVQSRSEVAAVEFWLPSKWEPGFRLWCGLRRPTQSAAAACWWSPCDRWLRSSRLHRRQRRRIVR